MTSTISTWRDLTGRLQKFRKAGYLYRGQPNKPTYALKPKAGRVDKASGSARKHPYTLKDEMRVFDDFVRSARPYVPHDPQSKAEWLALAQHHGLPTRLLDWSESLLVAAYFAVTNTTFGGVIYCLRDIELLAKDQEDFVFDQQKILSYRPPHISPRIPVQQSVFTIHPTPDKAMAGTSLEVWEIPQQECWEIKQCLASAGINHASLFPGIDGLAAHLSWLYKWAYFPQHGKDRPSQPQ